MQYSNNKTKIMVEQDKPFQDKYLEQMSLLLGEGRSPWTAARFMKERIAHAHEFPDLLSYLDVPDLIFYDSRTRSGNPNGNPKFILTVDKNGRVTEEGRKALEFINPNAKLAPDYEFNPNSFYDSLPGIMVRSGLPALEVLEKHLTQKEILESKVWRILARHPDEVDKEFAEDRTLLKEYANWVKIQTKQETNMGVYLNYNPRDEYYINPKLMAFCVGRLVFKSEIGFRKILDHEINGRFVGYLAPI